MPARAGPSMSRGLTTVFGGTGFLGGTIVRELASRGRPVRIAARNPVRPDWATASEKIQFATADIRDDASVARALEGATAAVNAVSLWTESGGDNTFEAVHVQGAARVGRLARQAGVEQVLLVSGIGADPASRSPFVRARAQGEQRLRETFPDATVIRPSVMFGAGDAFLSTLAGISRLPLIPLFGRGDTRLQPAFVGDVADAMVRLLGMSFDGQGVYEFGGAQVYAYREVVEQVLAHLGRRRPVLPVPFPVWHALARAMQALPNPPLTRDQVILMENDNVVHEGVGTFADVGIRPRSLEECLGAVLGKRRNGRPDGEQ
jgi:uncharacterized protein YbjT (DUF2867 family)